MAASKTVRPQTLIAALVLCAAVGVFGYTFAQATLFAPVEEELTVAEGAPRTARANPAEYPARLRIPALSIDAAVQDVGIGKSGRMAVPTNYSDAGWYRYGPLPGQLGSAVMDGHVDNGFGRAGIFARLHELKGGEEIVVENKKGKRVRFVVEAVEEYATADVPLQRVFAEGGPARLVLITCEGSFDPKTKSYDRRLIVYARLANN